MPNHQSPRSLLSTFILALAVLTPFSAQAQRSDFGTSFNSLRPPQRKLVDDFVIRLNRTLGTKYETAAAYDAARVSIRTTFDAVTHALLNTKLTDSSGKSLGTALDLVEAVEEVAGERPGERGDRQFRVYFAMKPGAQQTLEAAREFNHEPDNTVFHAGYPTCFRLIGSVPSIQISLSRDARRADIDVDYRSSKIPAAMLNGHLRSANSDVRAGDNADRHAGKWAGFSAWWKNLFASSPSPGSTAPPAQTSLIPARPRVSSKQGVDAAMHDFLQSWLVEQDAPSAAAYFGPRSFACVELDARRKNQPLAPGMARFSILATLRDLSTRLGKAPTPSAFVSALQPWDSAMRLHQNNYPGEFLLMDISDEAAGALECTSSSRPDPKALDLPEKRRFGNYFGSVLRLAQPGAPQRILYFLWTKEGPSWRIVNVGTLDAAEKELPSLRIVEKSAEKQLPRIAGDPAAATAVHTFLSDWLVQGDIKKATAFFSPQSKSCIEPGQSPANAMRQFHRSLGGLKQLSDAVEPVPPINDRLSLITQPHEQLFALFTGPDALGDAFLCQNRDTKRAAPSAGGPSGKYYAASFRVKLPASTDTTAVLITLWSKDAGQWKIVAWRVEAP
ncbi:MAG: hypothetical protein HY821_14220 [Acidobacteria bacterium]|nr:hypothetical protein [Acidobacteriota bacterium]